MRVQPLFLAALCAHAATTVYQASVDQLTVVHGAAARRFRHPPHRAQIPPRRTRRPVPRRPRPLRPRHPHHRQALRALRLGPHREPHRPRHSIARPSPPAPRSPWRPCPSTSTPTSLGGTRPWTRLSLQVHRHPRAGPDPPHRRQRRRLPGQGLVRRRLASTKPPTNDAWPAREAVQTFGPAYRYPAAGWIYLHIEGTALRARLPARLPDGARDSRVPRTLRRRSRRQRRRLGQPPHHGQRPLPARLRSRDPRGDARHRRWRLRRRRQVAGPPPRPGRYRGRQRHRGTRRAPLAP